MNDLDAQERRLLAGARRALSPKLADQQRLLAALDSTLALPHEAPRSSAPEAKLLRYVLGASALGVAALLGYGWGYRAGKNAVPAPAVAAPVAVSRVVASSVAVPAVALSAALPVLERQARAREPRAPAVQRSAVVAPAIAPVEPPPGLDEEVRQLRRIERALREGNPRLALVIAEDLDLRMPRGQLLVERRAASLMAGCQLGVDGAEQVAERFLNDNPDSAYAARLREVCKLAASPQRTLPGAGTNETRKAGDR